MMIAERVQDVEPILENNASLRSIPQRGFWRKFCSIPNVIWEKWLNEEYDRGNINIKPFGEEMDAIAARKLRDSDWAKLRTDGAGPSWVRVGTGEWRKENN